MRAQEAKGDPPLVDPGWGLAFEAADVAGPRGEGGEAEAQAAADRLGEGGGRGFAVSAL